MRRRGTCLQVLELLPEGRGAGWEVRLGHRILLDAALAAAHVPKVLPSPGCEGLRETSIFEGLLLVLCFIHEYGLSALYCTTQPNSKLSLYSCIAQELRRAVLQVLGSTAGAGSPRNPRARAARWPAIRAALAGLGLSSAAIAGCRQLLLQACPVLVWMPCNCSSVQSGRQC